MTKARKSLLAIILGLFGITIASREAMPVPATSPRVWTSPLTPRDMIAISSKIDREYFDGSIARNFGPYFIPAMIMIESAGRIDAVRGEGHLGRSVGLMQPLESTANWLFSDMGYTAFRPNLFNAEANVYFGMSYVEYLSTFSSNPDWVVRGYNGGPRWESKSEQALANTLNHLIKHREAVATFERIT